MLEGLQTYYKQTGVTPGVPNQLGKTADPYVSGTAYPSVALGNYDVPDGWPGKVVKHGKGEVPGPPVWFEEEDVQEAVAGAGYQSDNQEESDIFFYHTDHLQSTTYLTDSVGNVSQFVWYAPYGEALIDEHVGSYENPYKFSGKELDENTGLYDHGARHREPSSGVWYGVDALFEKYPEISPYSYCGGNPVRFVDMDGNSPIYNTDGELIGTDDHGLKGYPMVLNMNDFQQGMPESEAKKHNIGLKKFKDNVAVDKFRNSYSGLKERPDWDGFLTKEEADNWWKGKTGEPLYVDQSKIELPGIDTKSFNNEDGTKISKNFIWGLSNTGKVYGTISLLLEDAATGLVRIGRDEFLDKYDFDMDGRFFRDIATWVGRPGKATDGVEFIIKGYGRAKVPVVK